MFVDASVIIAILAREPGCEEIEKRLADATGPYFVSPLVRFEATAALARKKSDPQAKGTNPSPDLIEQARLAVDAFIGAVGAEETPITPAIGNLAIDACARYGKAVGDQADLNFGDCFAYACAKALRVPLFYKGNDFALTDLA